MITPKGFSRDATVIQLTPEQVEQSIAMAKNGWQFKGHIPSAEAASGIFGDVVHGGDVIIGGELYVKTGHNKVAKVGGDISINRVSPYVKVTSKYFQ